MRGNLLLSLVALAAAGLQTTAAQGNATTDRAPPPSRSLLSPLKSDIYGSNPGYYIVWWFAPAGAIVTEFYSTMQVPNLSSDTKDGPRYVWPGMENAATDFVFQNVIGDQQPQGEWSFATWYVGEGEATEYGHFQVNKGDTILNQFYLEDQSSNTWISDWTRNSNGQTSNGGIEHTFTTEGAFTNAMFAIELYNPAQWDFGSVTYTDITITVNSASTSWCTSPQIYGGFQYTMTTPTVSVNGGSSTCYISKLVFVSP